MSKKFRNENDQYYDRIRKFRDEDEVWEALEKDLDHRLEPSIKSFLIEQGYDRAAIGEAEEEANFTLLKDVARKLRKMVTDASNERKQIAANRPLNPTKHLVSNHYNSASPDEFAIQARSEMRDLWSLFLAASKRKERPVINFREEFLKEGLLVASEVPDWVAKYSPEGQDISWVLFQMDLTLNETPENLCSPMDRGTVYRLLASPGLVTSYEDRADEVGGMGSPLAQLILLGAALAHDTGWLLGEAIWFVLTDEVPVLPTILAVPIKVNVSFVQLRAVGSKNGQE